jgi:hypothetical protein
MPENEQLAALRRMKNEGRISDGEFDRLARGLFLGPPDEESPEEEPGESSIEPPVGRGSPPRFEMPSLRPGVSANFIIGLGLLALFLIAASVAGLVPWLSTIALILLLGTTIIEGWRKITMIGAIAVGVIAVINIVGSLTDQPAPTQPVVVATTTPTDPHPPVPGSLNIYMDQITDAWNTVDGPPRIIKGLTRHNETGEYDTFIYRWGEWGRLAGAYDPDNEVLYALLVSGQLGKEETGQLYLPLCFMVAPYSQACVDAYFEHGLAGGVLEDYAGVDHETEWQYEDQTWRIEIAQNVMTIRVFGADAA